MSFFVCLVLWVAALGPGGDEPFSLTVLHTNDTHGRPLAFKRGGTLVGGMAARKWAVDRLRERHGELLLVDAGDVCDGMPVSNLNGTEPDFVGMNLLGYDAMAVGNHEFSHDLERILELERTAGFPFLCANVVKKGTGVHPFEPYVILEHRKRRIALLGLVTGYLKKMTITERLADLELLDPLEAARKWIPILAEKADHIIVLSHCGYGFDRNVLAQKVEGIDLIVGGHSHSVLVEPERVGDTVVVQAGKHGLFLGLVTLHFAGKELERFEGGLLPINFTPGDREQYLDIGPLEEDAPILAKLEPYRSRLSGLLNRVVGSVAAPRAGRKEGWLDSPWGNLTADAMRWAAGADCAITNMGGIRTELGPGAVTVEDVVSMLPFDNNVIVVDLKGAVLLEALEHAVLVREERPRASGAFSGIAVVVKPGSDSIESVEVAGAALSETRTYRVAVNSFMFQGGAGFDMLAVNKGFDDLGFKYSDALVRYLEEKKNVIPASEGRVRISGRKN